MAVSPSLYPLVMSHLGRKEVINCSTRIGHAADQHGVKQRTADAPGRNTRSALGKRHSPCASAGLEGGGIAVHDSCPRFRLLVLDRCCARRTLPRHEVGIFYGTNYGGLSGIVQTMVLCRDRSTDGRLACDPGAPIQACRACQASPAQAPSVCTPHRGHTPHNAGEERWTDAAGAIAQPKRLLRSWNAASTARGHVHRFDSAHRPESWQGLRLAHEQVKGGAS